MELGSKVKTLIWDGKTLKLIDQRKLPFVQEYFICDSYEKVFVAIKDMIVRGAPAIGVTAAYGVAIAALQFVDKDGSKDSFFSHLEKAIEKLASSRPTAVNLFWALNRLKKIIKENENLKIEQIKNKIIMEAELIEKEDIEINKKIGNYGVEALGEIKGKDNKLKILTHCNAGALATAGYGTALGIIRSLANINRISNIVVDETRPYLQGARLTAWELEQEKIPFFIITDNMAAFMMSKGEVDAVVVGADRIASNGDSANKIGTFGVSILARYFNIPFFVAAPTSTIDMSIASGSDIPIEERDSDEVRKLMGKKIIPDYMPVRNPSFDVTLAENISAIITEKGIIRHPLDVNIRKVLISDC